MSTTPHVGICGAGAFGTALALIAARAGNHVTLFARTTAQAETMVQTRQSPRLDGVALPPEIAITADRDLVSAVDILLMAVPAQASAETLGGLADRVRAGTPIIACAKGVERETGRLQSAIITDLVPDAVAAALSGPGFASEIARDMPTAVTIAAADTAVAAGLCARLSTATFRPYASGDLVGVEIAGAIKNVLAIACGVAMGRALGESARAALIARGLAEMTRLGVAMGARPDTFLGLSGVGDLVLTATSTKSRNMMFGWQIGEGVPLADLTAPDRPLAEGYFTARIASDIAKRAQVEMPIVQAVADIIDGQVDVDTAINRLIARPLTRE
ncbi:MAG: NAD(P)H-dependent glycerol-3-phosphate dehydrogenase [Alphaproteobacteria bacterium]